MLFSSTIRFPHLIELCRTLHHQLDVGISPVRIFQHHSKYGARRLRPIAERMHKQLQAGNSLASAMKKEPAFPPLLVSLVSVGEETGHLAEIFGELEKYYTLQWQLKKKFRAQIIGPVLQFLFAVFVVAALIWFLGFVVGPQGPTVTVFGLVGTTGAVIFLGLTFGTILLIYLLYRAATRAMKGKEFADRFLLRVPGLGPCLQALALGRFTLALHLTLESAMPIHRALRLSLQSTGNAVYQAQTNRITRELKAGESLTDVLNGTRVFPRDFLSIMAVAEETGRVPEVMRKQCHHYHEVAERRLRALTSLLGWGIWLIYAIYAIIMIFHLAGIYFSTLQI